MPERGFIIKLSVIILAIFGLFTICFTMGLLSKSIWLSAIKKPIIFSQPIATILSSNNNPSPTPPGPSSNPTLLTPATEVLIERTQVTSAQNTPNPDEPIGTPDEPIGTPINTPTLIASPTVTIGSINFDSWCIPWHTEASRGKVIRIIDGITIEVEIDGDPFIVRYIGLDLPSPDFHAQSLETNAELVFNGEILLVKDRSEMDEEGRLLRYVIAGGSLY